MQTPSIGTYGFALLLSCTTCIVSLGTGLMNMIVAFAKERRQEQLDTDEGSATKPTGSDADRIDTNDNVVKTYADRNGQKNKKKLKSNGHLKQFETTSSSKTKKMAKSQTNGFRKNNGITQDGGSVRHRIVVGPYVGIYGYAGYDTWSKVTWSQRHSTRDHNSI